MVGWMDGFEGFLKIFKFWSEVGIWKMLKITAYFKKKSY